MENIVFIIPMLMCIVLALVVLNSTLQKIANKTYRFENYNNIKWENQNRYQTPQEKPTRNIEDLATLVLLEEQRDRKLKGE